MAPHSTLPLAVEGIVKSFPGVKALKGVSFECRAGEIHALVGENGAGKSTLMRILAGVYQPDAGTIRIDGTSVGLTGPANAVQHGIAMVYQDTRLVPDLDTAQNIFLGREPGGTFVAYGKMRADAAALLSRLGETLDLNERVGDKPLAERQIIELARALSSNARVLILDEPTSALTPREVEKLFAILRDLRQQGTSTIFISHRLPEIFAIADRITVLKDGEMIGTVDAKTTTEDQIVNMMVGRDLALAYPPRAEKLGDVVLSVEKLCSDSRFADVDLKVRAGEILGLGGIAGSGQQDIVRALFGLLPVTGNIAISGEAAKLGSPGDAIRSGIVYLPSDRRGEGMFLPHSISDNIVLPHVKDWARLGVLDIPHEREAVDKQIASLKVKTPSPRQPVELLSGGNQQKVTFARWLLANPKICIFDEPTQGVDVGTKLEIYMLIRELAQRGLAIIVVSSDVMELIGISDRIQVVANGRIVDEVAGAEASEERIIGSAVKSVAAAQVAELKPVRKGVSTPFARFLNRYGATLLLVVLTAVLCAYTAAETPYFLTQRNFSSLAIQIAPLIIVALGQFAVILLGGIDLSAGPTISLSTTIASFLLASGSPVGLVGGVIAVLLAGLAIGLLNGLLIQRLKLPDLIATLSTFSAVAGLALIVRSAPGGLLDGNFTGMILMRVGTVPLAFIVACLMVVIFELLLSRGRLGMRLLSVGSSPDAAFVAGVNVGRVRFCAYLFCGLMAAIAGLVIASRIGSGDPQSGTNFTLLSVTAVVLGGTSVFGGRGTAVGVFVAACLLMIIQNAMNHLQISAYWQYVFTGVLTLVAVAAYATRGNGAVSR